MGARVVLSAASVQLRVAVSRASWAKYETTLKGLGYGRGARRMVLRLVLDIALEEAAASFILGRARLTSEIRAAIAAAISKGRKKS